MIKEIGFTKNLENEYEFKPVSIDVKMDQPFKHNIDALKFSSYFHENLDGKILNINNCAIAGDWIPVSRWTKLVCVSQNFKNIFEKKIKCHWYPTSNPKYFIFLLDNSIDGLNKDKTLIINKKDRPYWYESIENEVFIDGIEDEYLFNLTIEPLKKFCTSKFEELYKNNNLTGIQFYKDINFQRKDGAVFDGFRFKKYDTEGNCLE